MELVWRKRRWYCREPWCGRKSFTESMPAVPAGARITTRLREHAGDLVVDGRCATVAAAGRMTGVSWPTAMDAVRAAAERVLDEAPGPVQVLGVDEVRRGRPRWRPAEPAPPPGPNRRPERAGAGRARSRSCRSRSCRSRSCRPGKRPERGRWPTGGTSGSPTSAAGRGCSVRSRAAPPMTSPTGWPSSLLPGATRSGTWDQIYKNL